METVTLSPFVWTPRERLRQAGPAALSTAELVSLVLRMGAAGENGVDLAGRMLAEHGGLVGIARMSLFQLEGEVRGLGPARAAQLQAVLEIGRRLALEVMGEQPLIRSPADAARLLMPGMGALEQEHLRVLLLNTRNRVIAVHEVYKGNLHTSVIRVGEIFREAIRRNSASVIVAHNHVSGDCSPSSEDVTVTRALVEAGALLDIPLVDHLVIGQGKYVSLKERGLGFEPTLPRPT